MVPAYQPRCLHLNFRMAAVMLYRWEWSVQNWNCDQQSLFLNRLPKMMMICQCHYAVATRKSLSATSIQRYAPEILHASPSSWCAAPLSGPASQYFPCPTWYLTFWKLTHHSFNNSHHLSPVYHSAEFFWVILYLQWADTTYFWSWWLLKWWSYCLPDVTYFWSWWPLLQWSCCIHQGLVHAISKWELFPTGQVVLESRVSDISK